MESDILILIRFHFKLHFVMYTSVPGGLAGESSQQKSNDTWNADDLFGTKYLLVHANRTACVNYSVA